MTHAVTASDDSDNVVNYTYITVTVDSNTRTQVALEGHKVRPELSNTQAMSGE